MESPSNSSSKKTNSWLRSPEKVRPQSRPLRQFPYLRYCYCSISKKRLSHSIPHIDTERGGTNCPPLWRQACAEMETYPENLPICFPACPVPYLRAAAAGYQAENLHPARRHCLKRCGRPHSLGSHRLQVEFAETIRPCHPSRWQIDPSDRTRQGRSAFGNQCGHPYQFYTPDDVLPVALPFP